MDKITSPSWHEANQQFLSTELNRLRVLLERYSAGGTEAAPREVHAPEIGSRTFETESRTGTLFPLDAICVAFDLSSFERDLLLLCAGVELDASLAAACAKARGDTGHTNPTFSLALSILAAPHWSALTPDAPLRRWNLLELGEGDLLVSRALKIEERVLHYLLGLFYLEEPLQGLIERLLPPEELPYPHRAIANQVSAAWAEGMAEQPRPVVQLLGADKTSLKDIAVTACRTLGLRLYTFRAVEVPLLVREREQLARSWERESALSGSALMLDCSESLSPEHQHAAITFAERLQSLVVIASQEPLAIYGKPMLRLDVHPLPATEQYALWRKALGPLAAGLNGQIDNLIMQFNLDASSIQAAAAEAAQNPDGANVGVQLWQACRKQARVRVEDFAQRIEPRAVWKDLVLPPFQIELLHSLATQVRNRAKVYQTWGFEERSARGLGISALFAGPSGTGKTMAAEVLANELNLDLYRIDLSSVVSKYIGETEKNLRHLFEAAEAGGAILLFDEADALFGKRSEVQDSHDRYANIEVSYLLQRMETYRGLAILTTNLKNALDPAFLRRIRFIVQFPFPDAMLRRQIWAQIFPASTPTEGLDPGRLAQLAVTGGHIRNIALNAAFLAADESRPVRMQHLLRATHSEYAKLEKALTDTELEGWV
jgi:hypothetical protein